MNILHISTRLILGGSQENTVLSCEGQSRLGHDVHLAFGPIYGPEGSLLDRVLHGTPDQVRTATRATIHAHEVPNLVRQIDPAKDRRALRELEALIRQLKPDLVHTHSSKAGILGRVAAWRVLRASRSDASLTPPGIVHTIHGPPFMPVDGGPARRLKTRAINAAYVLAERHAARRCHVIVSVAHEMTRQFLSRGIGVPAQYTTVYSGMETRRYLDAAPGETRDEMRRALNLAPTDIVIGTVARLAEHKGHDDLLDALGDAMKARPSLKLLWVGDGWWRSRLEARVRAMGLSAQVVLTGLVPSERVAAHMRAMDILVHPSYREGLPRTVPQALLCGVPVVAYDVDGTREACIDHTTGRLVPLGDLVRLREAILALAESPAERARLAAAGRELCRERFAAETMVRELEVVYARAIALARAPRKGP